MLGHGFGGDATVGLNHALAEQALFAGGAGDTVVVHAVAVFIEVVADLFDRLPGRAQQRVAGGAVARAPADPAADLHALVDPPIAVLVEAVDGEEKRNANGTRRAGGVCDAEQWLTLGCGAFQSRPRHPEFDGTISDAVVLGDRGLRHRDGSCSGPTDNGGDGVLGAHRPSPPAAT